MGPAAGRQRPGCARLPPGVPRAAGRRLCLSRASQPPERAVDPSMGVRARLSVPPFTCPQSPGGLFAWLARHWDQLHRQRLLRAPASPFPQAAPLPGKPSVTTSPPAPCTPKRATSRASLPYVAAGTSEAGSQPSHLSFPGRVRLLRRPQSLVLGASLLTRWHSWQSWWPALSWLILERVKKKIVIATARLQTALPGSREGGLFGERLVRPPASSEALEMPPGSMAPCFSLLSWFHVVIFGRPGLLCAPQPSSLTTSAEARSSGSISQRSSCSRPDGLFPRRAGRREWENYLGLLSLSLKPTLLPVSSQFSQRLSSL